MEHIVTFLCAALGGGIFVFIQFLIQRHDTKKGIFAELTRDLKALEKKFDVFEITSTRRYILRFSQEVRHGVRHTVEEWEQCILDIDEYRKYCRNHPEYENNRCQMAVKLLEDTYKRCLESNDFEV